jgi:hypothetical protein
MKIDINVSKEDCELILKEFGYTSEKVILYHNLLDIPDDSDDNLRGVEYMVAYPVNDKPKVLDENKPMADECDDILYDNVMSKLFNKLIMKAIINSL